MKTAKRTLHRGERAVQARMQTPSSLAAAIPQYIEPALSPVHVAFYTGLAYLPLATLDEGGRPWASLLVTRGDRVAGIDAADMAAE